MRSIMNPTDILEDDIYFNEKQRENFKKATRNLSEEVTDSLWNLIQMQCISLSIPLEDSLTILLTENAAYKESITLYHVKGFSQYNNRSFEGYFYNTGQLVYNEEDKCFSIYGELEDPIDESTFPFAITFDSAKTTIEVFNAMDEFMVYENPWKDITDIARLIKKKAYLPGDYCNESELALLPQIEELLELSRDSKKIRELCHKKHEPKWREFYNKIKVSQETYPNRVDQYTPSDLLIQTRTKIQQLLENEGYTGTYPNFIKKEAMRGIHLEESYDTTYFIGMKKNVEYHIKCTESILEDEYFNIHFLCGCAQLKKDEEIKDVYSCCFDAKGHRIFHSVFHDIPLFDTTDLIPHTPSNLTSTVKIAAKKAECKRLTKEEKKDYHGLLNPFWSIFLSFLVIGGGLFSLFFNGAMMLLAIILLCIFDKFQSIGDLFQEIPWGHFIAFSWIAFGGSMGIITALTKRK